MNWKKTIKWTAIVFAGTVATLIIAAAIIVRTQAFHRFVLAKLVQQAYQSAGARLDVGNFVIHWRDLSVDFYNLRVHGTESASDRPLLAANHLKVGLKIVSLLRRKVDFNEFIVDQPTLALQIDASGNSNFPGPPGPRKTASPATDVFDLGIQHVAINSGIVYYNDRQIPLSAELHDLQTKVDLNNLTGNYRASLKYAQGRFRFKDFQPFEHDAQMQLTASRTGLVVDQLAARIGASHITVHGSLKNYAAPAIQASYEAAINTSDLAHIANLASAPTGEVAVNGSIRYQNAANESFLDALYADGALSSPALVFRAGDTTAAARSVRTVFRLENGDLRVQDLSAEVLGGRLNGDFAMLHLGGQPASSLNASLSDVSLTNAARALLPRASRPPVSGRMNIKAQAAWTTNIHDVKARALVLITGPLQQPSANSGIPVNGKIDVRYDGARDTASFGQSNIRTKNTELSLAGVLSDHSSLNVQANATDLSELNELVSLIKNTGHSRSTANSQPIALSGSGSFSGQVVGPVSSPRVTGVLSASNFQVDGSSWRSLRTNLEFGSSAAALENATLVSTREGQIKLSGRAELKNWSFTPASRITAQAAASRMSVADLEHFAGLRYPIGGDLSADLSFDGTQQHPAGHGSLTIANAVAWTQPVTNFAVNFQGDGTSVRSTVQLKAAGGALSANIQYMPMTQEYEVNANTSGIQLDRINALQPRNGISGTLSGSVSGRGSVKDPQLDANLTASNIQIRDQNIPRVEARVVIAHQQSDFTLHSEFGQGSVQAQGEVGLQGDHPARATLDVKALPLSLLLANYLPSGGPHLGGGTDIHATLQGPLGDPARIEAHVEIPTLTIGYMSEQVASARPLRLDYRNGIVTIDDFEMKGAGTDLSVRGSVPVKSAAPMNVSAKGTLDLAALKGFTPELESSGHVDLDVAAGGTFSSPAMRGQIKMVDARLSSDSIPIGFDKMNGVISINGNRLELTQLSGTAGGGSVSGRGFFVYGQGSNFNAVIDANNVRVRYPAGVRAVVNGNIQINGTPASSVLSGRVLIDRLSFTQQFDMAEFMGQFSGDTTPSSPSAFEENMRLNVAVQSAQLLDAQSTKVSVEGSANLTVGGTLAMPVILGRTTFTSGEIFFLGKRYEVQSGTIEFANPIHTQPVVNLFVGTTVQQYNITLNFVGPIDRLRTNYTSTPPLPPADIINLIAFGQTAEQSASAASTPATVGAQSVLAQGVASQVSGRIEKLAGISQLTIDPLAATNTNNPGAQLSIQQRVTGNLLLTFSTDVTSTQAEAIQLQYQANRNVSVTVLRDQNGGYAMDVRVRKTF